MKVGVTLPVGVVGTDGRVLSYTEVRGLAQAAEGSGLDSIWIYDHLIFHFPERPREGVWESWTVLSALAEATQRVELGNIVICTAHRNPAVLAKMAVTLDEVSQQRVILGLGAGWNQPAFQMFGIPGDHLAGRFEEALQIIAPLVREGRVDFHGKYTSAVDCEILPAPRRPIPVMVGANRPRMLRLTARYADAWHTTGLGSVEQFASRRAALEVALAAVGRDPASIAMMASVNVTFPDLGPVPAGADDPTKYLRGESVEELAGALRTYREQGISHLQGWLYPLNDESIARFAAAAEGSR